MSTTALLPLEKLIPSCSIGSKRLLGSCVEGLVSAEPCSSASGTCVVQARVWVPGCRACCAALQAASSARAGHKGWCVQTAWEDWAVLPCVPSLPSCFCQSHLPSWPLQNSLESMGAAFPKHDEEDEDMREKEVQMESLICAFETLGKAWPRSPETQCKSPTWWHAE